jgi:hypothetical protein
MNAPPKEKAARENLGGLEKPSLGRVGNPHDSAPTPLPQEPPEHRNDRRRFLIWALMAGYTKPERVVERIVSELEEETR